MDNYCSNCGQHLKGNSVCQFCGNRFSSSSLLEPKRIEYDPRRQFEPPINRIIEAPTKWGKDDLQRNIRPSTRFEIFRRDNFTCKYCGRKAPEVKLEVDHAISWKEGGSSNPANLVTACMDCNRGKSGKSVGPL
jgi:5-methylcytosine-specific restriction endonuclease McrA